MLEAVLELRVEPGLVDELESLERVEVVADLGGPLGDARQDGQREPAADHRRGLGRALDVIVEAIEPRADDVLHGARELDLGAGAPDERAVAHGDEPVLP